MKISTNILKYIAIITMTIDHIGYVLFPKYKILRFIGRLSYPIFAYLVSEGIKHTHDKKLYLLRMVFFAGLSQVILYYAGFTFINVLFTYTLAIIGIYAIDHKLTVIAVFMMFIAHYFDTDYSYYGVAIIYLFYYLNDKRIIRNILYVLLTIVFVYTYNFRCDYNLFMQVIKSNNYQSILLCFCQLLSFIALPCFIDLDSHELKKGRFKYNKYIFYVYYPLHLVVLKLLERII